MTSRLAAATVTMGAAIVLAPTAASAGVGLGVTPTFPSPVTVGQTSLPASLQITNVSTPSDSSNPVAINTITLVPACGTPFATGPGDCPAVSADAGVFQVSPTATGEVGTACAGKVFSVAIVDAATGKVSFTTSPSVVLQPPGTAGGLDTCKIDFTFSVLKAPTKDSQPAPGLQTSQIGYAVGINTTTNNLGSGFGSSNVTVNLAAPSLVTTASGPPPGVPGTVSDTATLSGGSSPSGAITFRLYGPNDPNCANPPVFTSAAIPVAGNGMYNSGNATVTAAGSYRWTATYSGDANNLSASSPCGAANESVTVTGTTRLVRAVDFDGDGKADVAVYRPSTGEWFIRNSATGTSTVVVWGIATDQPVPADYDGDGKADVAVYRPSTGEWFIRNSSTGAGTVFVWGVSTDQPVPANYDGDTMADVAVYRPSTGQWFIRNSSTGAGTVVVWGVSTDQPVPSNYDGDTKADVAVYRPSTGEWFIRNSSTGAGTVVVWGVSTDQPVPGNYDGDTMADVAVYRPSTGVWYLRESTAGTVTVLWGVSTDRPVGN